MKHRNHYNFICDDEDIEYLQMVSKRVYGNSMGGNKSELFRTIIKEHKRGQLLNERVAGLLANLSKYYKVDQLKLLEALLNFIWKRKPDMRQILNND